jgi:hypothetical protein
MPNFGNLFILIYLQSPFASVCAFWGLFCPPENGQLGIFLFREGQGSDTDSTRMDTASDVPNYVTNATLELTLFPMGFTKFEGLMNQLPLWHGKDLPSGYRYRELFAHLPVVPSTPAAGRGRKPFDHNFLLRALIYRCLRQIPTLAELVFELNNNPTVLECLGGNPLKPVPTIERFSHFMRNTDNSVLQSVRVALVRSLIAEQVIQGNVIALDSCSVAARVRENNLKTGLSKNRFDKTTSPKGDPETGLGVRIHYPSETKKEVTYFWGYRNHTVSDTTSELTLWEETHPANVSEVKRAVPMLEAIKTLSLPIQFVTGDSEYDVEVILRYIVDELKAQPIVAANPRRSGDAGYSIRSGKVYCAADLPMAHKGKFTAKVSGFTYRQYCCPLHWRKRFQRQYLLCPVGHPKFLEQKGCNVLIRLTPTIRTQIPYGTEQFKNVYSKRTAIERTYSRLLAITMQNPTVRGLRANKNHCTIAHISTLLVALTAARMGEKDKVRWIKSFVPRFLKN